VLSQLPSCCPEYWYEQYDYFESFIPTSESSGVREKRWLDEQFEAIDFEASCKVATATLTISTASVKKEMFRLTQIKSYHSEGAIKRVRKPVSSKRTLSYSSQAQTIILTIVKRLRGRFWVFSQMLK